MKVLALQDLFKMTYFLQPSLAQKLTTILTLPSLLKTLTGFFIDARIVEKRKNVLLVMALLQFVCFLGVGVI